MKRQGSVTPLNFAAIGIFARFFCLTLFLGLILTPVAAIAAVNMFLEIDGVEGDATDPRHRGAIVVVDFSEVYESNQDRFRIVATKLVDKSSPTLRQMLNSNESADRAILTIYTPGPKLGSEETVVIEMRKVSIHSVIALGSSDDDRLTETVTLNFKRGLWSYTPISSDGSSDGTISLRYDIKATTRN